MGISAKTIIFLSALVICSSISLAFSNIIWMGQGQTVATMNIKNGIAELHNVKLLDVSGETSRMCGFLVDNSTVWIKEDGDANVNGARVYVREIVRVHEQLQDRDVCRVIIGGAILSIAKEEGKTTENITSNKTISSSKGDKIILEQAENASEMKDIMGESGTELPLKQPQGQPQENKTNPSFFSRIRAWFSGLF